MDLLGGMDPRHGHFSAKMYAKTKELGPMGSVGPARHLDPPMLFVAEVFISHLYTSNLTVDSCAHAHYMYAISISVHHERKDA